MPEPSLRDPIRARLDELARPVNGKFRAGYLESALCAVLDLCDRAHSEGRTIHPSWIKLRIAEALGVEPAAKPDPYLWWDGSNPGAPGGG